MNKMNLVLSVCALSLAFGTVGAQAANMNKNMRNMGVTNYGYLTPEKQETFSFAANAQPGRVGECKVRNISQGRVILVIPNDRTLVLTPQNTSGTFNIPQKNYFFAKYTLKAASTPISVLNPVNVVRMTTAPFTGKNNTQAASQVMLMCKFY